MKISLFKRIFIILFCLTISLSCIFAFSNNRRVYADEEVTNVAFTSSNIFIPIASTTSNADFYTFNFQFVTNVIDYQTTNVEFTFNLFRNSNSNTSSERVYFELIGLGLYDNSSGTLVTSSVDFLDTNKFSYDFTTGIVRTEIYLHLFDTFNYDIELVINSPFTTNYAFNSVTFDSDSNGNIISYNRLDNSSLSCRFICMDSICPAFRFTPRTYIISTESLSDNQFYKFGYADGYRDGKIDGYEEGYDFGFEEGELTGLEIGRQEGGNYTFLTLMSSVVDAPIQALTGLFDFEILGFNLFGLFRAILTLLIFIAVIRLIF